MGLIDLIWVDVSFAQASLEPDLVKGLSHDYAQALSRG